MFHVKQWGIFMRKAAERVAVPPRKKHSVFHVKQLRFRIREQQRAVWVKRQTEGSVAAEKLLLR